MLSPQHVLVTQGQPTLGGLPATAWREGPALHLQQFCELELPREPTRNVSEPGFAAQPSPAPSLGTRTRCQAGQPAVPSPWPWQSGSPWSCRTGTASLGGSAHPPGSAFSTDPSAPAQEQTQNHSQPPVQAPVPAEPAGQSSLVLWLNKEGCHGRA